MRAQPIMPAADALKLRMKVGVHEFEAEGPRDVVIAQLETWRQLAGLGTASGASDGRTAAAGDPALQHVFTVDATQKLLTLRASPNGRRRNGDAALLILYGYRAYFAADGEAVPATRLKAAFAASRYRMQRVDRALAPHMASDWVRRSGRHTHQTYFLTTTGCQHAAALARQLARQR